jgi:hypothetical protein
MRIFLVIIVISFLGSSCTWLKEHEYEGSNTGYNYNSMGVGIPSELGKCYARCLIEDQYASDTSYILEYSGLNPTETLGVEYKTVTTAPATTKWEKKKADRNCHSSNPDDCLVWCLVDVEEQMQSFYIVTDTLNVKEFKEKLLVKHMLVKAGGFTEWKEIICAADVTPQLYREIQHKLKEAGFNIEVTGVVSKETKAALVKFQKINGLPVGALDTETLDVLGVNF